MVHKSQIWPILDVSVMFLRRLLRWDGVVNSVSVLFTPHVFVLSSCLPPLSSGPLCFVFLLLVAADSSSFSSKHNSLTPSPPFRPPPRMNGNTQVHACVGGTAVRDDIRTLQNGVHIVVGTPGRVYDMISRGALRLDRVGLFVLDEADEMLSRGFKDQIYDVFQYLPERVQVALFSATMPLDVLEVTNRFMPEPVRILVKKDELTLEGE